MTEHFCFQVILAVTLWIALPLSILRWRTAVFGIIFWDVVRDPLRKLFPEQQIAIVMFGLLLWLGCLCGCLLEHHRNWPNWAFLKSLRIPSVGLAIFLLCGITTGLVHSDPLPVMMLGFLSFTFPILGFPIGVRFGIHAKDVLRLSICYVILNSIGIASAIPEVLGVKSPILGGIQMEWYRFRGDFSIPLPSGIYRSPDILGLHAAFVCVCACLIGFYSERRWLKVSAVSFAGFSFVLLIFSARRKMLGLLLSFLVLHGVSCWRRRVSPFDRILSQPLLLSSAVVSLVLVSAVFWIHLQMQTLFAVTVITELPERFFNSIVASPFMTYNQTGFWGTGLGTATQGNAYFAPVGFSFGWQEDGIGRLMREGGVIGSVIFLISILWFVWNLLPSPSNVRGGWQNGLWSLFVANLCCLAISHQHLSGDPIFGAMLGLIAGLSSSPLQIAMAND